MDDTNKDILRILKDNGRMSFTEIGKKLGISRVAVQKRVKKMEDEGIIRGYKEARCNAHQMLLLCFPHCSCYAVQRIS